LTIGGPGHWRRHRGQLAKRTSSTTQLSVRHRHLPAIRKANGLDARGHPRGRVDREPDSVKLSGTFFPADPSQTWLKNVSDDQKLVADCLHGNPAAFGELVSRHQDRLYNTVFRLLEHPEDTRDVVQEAFLHAYQSLQSFKGDARFFTWLYRIAVNTAISFKRKRRLNLRLQPTADSGSIIDPLDPNETNRPGHALEMAELERRVHEALGCLSGEHRSVLVLKDMEGLKYEDMAEVLQVPIGTVRSRLHRARLELREILVNQESRAERPS
jgi:RNA polymerase sigma-70 factor (ECF subfamily)